MDTNGTRGTKSKRVRKRTLVIIVVVVVLLAAATVTAVVVTVYVKRNHDANQEPQHEGDGNACDDVVVIGAGVGGTYTAWKLRDRLLAVSLYEMSDRIGGRMHTVHMDGIPDINVELGAMRFLPVAHPRINATAHEIGLTVKTFQDGLGLGGGSWMYIRNKRFSRDMISTDGPYNIPLQYTGLETIRIQRYYFLNKTDYRDNETFSENSLLYTKTEDGVELYKQSASRAYTTMGVNHELQEMFCDNMGFHSYCGDVVASLVVPVGDPDGRTAPEVKTIGEGMERLPVKMLEMFLNQSNRHHFRTNMALQKIEKRSNGMMHLEFLDTNASSTVTSCAKNVVLTVPRSALLRIDWSGFRQPDIADILENALKDAPAAKVFLAYDEPWWRSLGIQTDHTVSDLPNRQTYDFGTSAFSNKSILLAVYTDMEDVSLWRELQFTQHSRKCSADDPKCLNSKVIEFAHKFIAEIYNISADDIPKPIDGAISLWDKYPYGAAWHIWRPGYVWDEIQEKMFQPVADDNVYVASGTFAPIEGSSWAESALESVDIVLKKLKI